MERGHRRGLTLNCAGYLKNNEKMFGRYGIVTVTGTVCEAVSGVLPCAVPVTVKV
jgi:hypothetical protein